MENSRFERFVRIAARYIDHVGPQTETFEHEIRVTVRADLTVQVFINAREQMRRAREEARMIRENLILIVNDLLEQFDNCPSGRCEDEDEICCRCISPLSIPDSD